MQFESKKLYDNIQFLIKNANLKIGDVEKELGCSSGYFARLKKDDASYSAPSIDKIYLLAKKFNLPIEVLGTADLCELNQTERYLFNYVDSLIKATIVEKIHWDAFSVEHFYDVPEFDSGELYPSHVLGNPIDTETVEYYSRFLKKTLKLIDSIYEACLYQNKFIITKVKDDNGVVFYELYVQNYSGSMYKNPSNICYSNSEGEYYPLLDKLYNQCRVSSRKPVLNSDVLAAFDSLQRALNNQPEPKNELGDDDLPF